MIKNGHSKRKKLLVNRHFQLSFIGVMAGSAFLVMITTYLANSYFFWKFGKLGMDLHLAADHAFFQFLKNQQILMSGIFLVNSLVVFTLLITLGLVFSHRIAGPLYKLQKHLLETSKSGRYSKVFFRKSDFFYELADAYNRQLPAKGGLRNVTHENKEKKSA